MQLNSLVNICDRLKKEFQYLSTFRSAKADTGLSEFMVVGELDKLQDIATYLCE